MRTLPQPPPDDKPPPSFLIPSTQAPLFRHFGVCPSSQTYIAYHLNFRLKILYALPCKRWSCRVCAQKKINTLSHQTARAKPNRLLTLTTNPALYGSPREAFDATRKQVPILIRRLRKQYGEIEYLRVTEATQRGYPHYHLMLRSAYIPHSVVKKLWSEMTGAYIVDIRQVKKTFSCYRYLVKYLSKIQDLEWTERHVSLSRNFIPPADDHLPETDETALGEIFFQHPAALLSERYVGYKLVQHGNVGYLLVPPESEEFDAPSQSQSDPE